MSDRALALVTSMGDPYLQMYKLLTSKEMDQGHLFQHWNDSTTHTNAKEFFDPIIAANSKYPGGLQSYVKNAKSLLHNSAQGQSSFAGYTPEVPIGERLEPLSPKFFEMEALGMKELAKTAFVLVAGGLGERLGYSGIKIELPVDVITKKTYLQWYCEYLKGFGHHNNTTPPPLCIMTSGDTHESTVDLLRKNNYYGLTRKGVRIVKQDKVPAMTDNNAHFALLEGHPYLLDMKPHGHGDVHSLLYLENVVQDWASAGIKWIVFFQDTNALVFHAIPAALGVSKAHGFQMNSLTVPRTAGEAAGGIVCLRKKDGTSITCNVEYNELGPLLKTVNNVGDIPDPATNQSPYPGNLNVFIISMREYLNDLLSTKGNIPEFVNPKYMKDSKEVFQKPTRLECMMQDYPKQMAPGSKVGFTQFDRWFAFSAVKNKASEAAVKSQNNLPPESASSGEHDLYSCNLRLLQKAGAVLTGPAPQQTTYLGITVTNGPKIHLSPEFAPSCQKILDSVHGLKLSSRSALIINAPGVRIENVVLDGALTISTSDTVVKDTTIQNAGITFQTFSDSQPQALAIRGYDAVVSEMSAL